MGRIFIRVVDGRPTAWPLTADAVRYLSPSETSFPGSTAAYEQADLCEFGFETFAEADKPAFDPLAEKITETTPVKVGGVWARQWRVVALTSAEAQAATQAAQASLIDAVSVATQARLDAFARTRNYDGILSACTYASSTNAKFAAEGAYCMKARDDTWATLYAVLAQVQAGTRPMPSGYADIEPELPALTWPA